VTFLNAVVARSTQEDPDMRTVAILTVTLAALAPAALRAADLPDINKRGARGSDEEKKFIDALTKAVSEAAHSTGKSPAWTKFDYAEPKERRTVLTITLEYKGAVTGTKHAADAVLTFDTGDPKTWELLTIEFKDKDNNIPPSKEKLAELTKKLNKAK
jgi:hypothetical protein